MIDYTELKRLAEDAIDDSRCRHDFQMEVTPKVVLSMIDALDVQAGSIEAVQAVNQRLASERDKLRTQNQALREALKDAARSLETVSKLAGRATYGNPPIDTFMQHHDEVRGYAASRAGVAFESLAQAEGEV